MPALTDGVIQEIMEDKGENLRETVSRDKPRSSYNAPSVAVPEKIVLCLDVTQDFICKPYVLKDENICSPFQLLKRAVATFVNNKYSFNSEHEFAVMSLEPGGVKWIHDFSSDPKEIVDAVNDLELICLTEPQEVNLLPVFKEVQNHIGNLPKVKINTIQFPTHVIRLILVYNSSYNLPNIEISDKTFAALTNSEYFYWDIMYLHDAGTSENKCQDIYNVLLDASVPASYVFESSRKVVKVFNNMAKLLAHPLQRFGDPLTD